MEFAEIDPREDFALSSCVGIAGRFSTLFPHQGATADDVAGRERFRNDLVFCRHVDYRLDVGWLDGDTPTGMTDIPECRYVRAAEICQQLRREILVLRNVGTS